MELYGNIKINYLNWRSIMREESFWAETGTEIEEYLKTLLPPGGNMKSWGHELKKNSG